MPVQLQCSRSGAWEPGNEASGMYPPLEEIWFHSGMYPPLEEIWFHSAPLQTV